MSSGNSTQDYAPKTRIRPGMRFLALLILMSLLAIVGYTYLPRAPREAGELCGTYVLDCPVVREELVLHPDGTFRQTVTVKSTSEVISSSGKWTYRTETSLIARFGEVELDRFCAVLKGPDELRPDYLHAKSGRAILPAEYVFGQLILGGRVDSWPDWKKSK